MTIFIATQKNSSLSIIKANILSVEHLEKKRPESTSELVQLQRSSFEMRNLCAETYPYDERCEVLRATCVVLVPKENIVLSLPCSVFILSIKTIRI